MQGAGGNAVTLVANLLPHALTSDFEVADPASQMMSTDWS